MQVIVRFDIAVRSLGDLGSTAARRRCLRPGPSSSDFKGKQGKTTVKAFYSYKLG